MRKYTQEEVDATKRNGYGIRDYPTGDYTDVKEFGNNCWFGNDCEFGYSQFGVGCYFGEDCSFGGNCKFGVGCTFNRWCEFGNSCNFGGKCRFKTSCYFGENCSFGEECSFDGWSNFGRRCSFGEYNNFKIACSFECRCRFAEKCTFGDGCKVEKDIVLLDFLKFEGFGSESRCTYFFKHPEGIYIRCGCFHGTIEEFRNKVQKTHMNNKYAQGYLKIADLAEWQFNDN